MADPKNNKNEKKENAQETPKVEIIRGRMPLPIVFQVKFDSGTDAELAAKYRTTNGKVSDIKKERNFGYITKDFKPTQEMIDNAKKYAEQLSDKSVLKAVSGMKVADEKEAAAFAEMRKSTRKTAPKTDKSAEGEATSTK